MDCNKEEAVRAKDIAEKKMLIRDFDCAKKLLLKALHLCPDIENGSHMLTVCEVHCSAETLVNGQNDHYGVLQIEPLADEFLIRKQYRKLALLLHPDKNKFAGAEAAFKLVGEAYKVLSDQTSRLAYDSKRRVQTCPLPPQNSRKVSRNMGAKAHASQYQHVGVKQQDRQQSSEFFASQFFWSVCVHCGILCQFPRSLLNREVQCQACLRIVCTFEITSQNVPSPGLDSPFYWTQSGFQHANDPAQYHHNSTSHAHFGSTAGTRTHESVASTHPAATKSSKVEKAEFCEVELEADQKKSENGKPGEKPPVAKNPMAATRAPKKAVSSNDSIPAQNGSAGGDKVHRTIFRNRSANDRYPRRTSRDTVNVSYKEYESDDDFASPPKRLRKVETGAKKRTRENPNEEKAGDDPLPKESGEEEEIHIISGSKANNPSADSRFNTPPDYSFSYPDSEFYNFDMDRDQGKFAVNQIWAVYDDDDGMPRYYALIRKVSSPNFKLYYTWLEYNPTNFAEKAWAKAQLPTACGNFKTGKGGNTSSQLMFSHLICCEKGRGNTYDIYPKKGEVWALFKGWDKHWSSIEQGSKKYAFEFVEVLSDNTSGQGFTVSHLEKVKGFLYLFARAQDKGIAMIPAGQLLKFSHRIPFFRVSAEGDRVLRESFELDPAALPENVANYVDCSLNKETMDVKASDACPQPSDEGNKVEGITVNDKTFRPFQDVQDTSSKISKDPSLNTSGEHIDTPLSNEQEPSSTEFFNFGEERLAEKIKEGQIWALYSDIDAYPNAYAWVKKADWAKEGVSVKLMEYSPYSEEEKLWSKNGLPVTCGRFKVLPDVIQYGSTHRFSHMVHPNSIKKKNFYEIYPNCGEIWALFSNWSLKWTSDDFRRRVEYAIVEVLERRVCVIKVRALTKAMGHKHVFMPDARSVAHVDIPLEEYLRFSHKIPAFRLTDQDCGKWKGGWELEPKSIPKNLVRMEPC